MPHRGVYRYAQNSAWRAVVTAAFFQLVAAAVEKTGDVWWWGRGGAKVLTHRYTLLVKLGACSLVELPIALYSN